MRSSGGRAWAGKCDVADEKSVAAFFEEVVSELGRVDILVNNAAVARDAHIALLGLRALFFLVGVAPDDQWQTYQPVINRVVSSIRFLR